MQMKGLSKYISKVAFAFVVMIVPTVEANLIDAPNGLGPIAGNDDPSGIQTIFFPGGTPVIELLYKAEYDDGVFDKDEGLFAAGGPSGPNFTITGLSGSSDDTATISWDLSTTDFFLTAVVWKGSSSWVYSGVAADQTKVGGPHDINMSLLNNSAISHIAFYGFEGSTDVPDTGTTLALLGIGMMALALVRRKRS